MGWTVRSMAMVAVLLAGCGADDLTSWQGYVESDSLYIGAPVAGRLMQLPVERGQQVAAQSLLFQLDAEPAASARDEAAAALSQAQATLADVEKGQRPEDLQIIEQRLQQSRALQEFSRAQWERARTLRKDGSVSQEQLDEAKANHVRDQALVKQVEAEQRVAQLGAREDQVQAAHAQVAAAEARLAQLQWQMAQVSTVAPAAGLIEDVLYRPGEFVGAGKPVVVLLPPERLRIPFYVPETMLGALQIGQAVTIQCDGCGSAFSAPITYISPQAEYTPPFIFSKNNRDKFMYRVEAVPTPEVARRLHVGQPVDVVAAISGSAG